MPPFRNPSFSFAYQADAGIPLRSGSNLSPDSHDDQIAFFSGGNPGRLYSRMGSFSIGVTLPQSRSAPL